MKKKLFASMLAVLLASSLAACGSESNKKSEAAQKQETPVSEKEKAEKNEPSEAQKKEKEEPKETEKKKESKSTEEKKDTGSSAKKASSAANKTSSSSNTAPSNKPNSNGSSIKPATPSKPAASTAPNKKPGAPQPSKSEPATHKHSYTQVVSSYLGNCIDKSFEVKRCSCGDEKSFEGGYGDHAWEYIPEQRQWIPVYKYAYECNECHKQFGHDDNAAALHSMDVCGGGYSLKQIGVEPGKGHWQVNAEAYYYCPLCKKIREIDA